MTQSLDRFLQAQQEDYAVALKEIQNGRKESHWIWYIFPQLKGLGFSYTSDYYGIKDHKEAEEYLAHPILGSRLREISGTLLSLPENDPRIILGFPDDLKVQSSMTLFHVIAPEEPIFLGVLEKFYGGKLDERTFSMLSINTEPDE